jgi:hypothetical protein
MIALRPIDNNTREQLNRQLSQIESLLAGDGIAIVSPIFYGLDVQVKRAIEHFKDRKARVLIVLDTPGGIAEVVERMVTCVRHHYQEVYFLIPDRAMSAGTIFAMSGDKIYMSYFSTLGPIDPQVEKDGKLFPALSYLNQFNRLCAKAEKGNLNTAEFALLQKLDLGELHHFEQAKELSVELLVNWLSQYKFKDWIQHASSREAVTEDEKRVRAKEIGNVLSNNERWRSHGRGISRETLAKEIRLRIDEVEAVAGLAEALEGYFGLLRDHMLREQFNSFVHTREVFG